uniref:Uncharacterized protein n=1 Tax=Rhizophora mucronata TaxID=61149 RepID=A0A2P2IIQ7_RHIMU
MPCLLVRVQSNVEWFRETCFFLYLHLPLPLLECMQSLVCASARGRSSRQ